MYVRTLDGLGLGKPSRDCSAWEKDPELFSKAIAQHYVSTELNQQLKIEGVRCGKGGRVCEVRFPGDITVVVRLVHVPNYVIVYARLPVPPEPGMPTYRRERREYDYSCTTVGELKFRRHTALVRIVLIDPSGIFKNTASLREEFRSRLEKKFNNLDPNWLKQNFFRFRVEYSSKESADKDKTVSGTLDFPVYLLGERHGLETVQDLMKKHRIPKTINKQDIYEIAKKGWEERDNWGVGIPSGESSRKVGFVKTHRVFREARSDLWQALVNATAHEIGHMGNLMRHSKKGLMKYPVPLDTEIDFAPDDRRKFLGNLLRLRDY